MPTVITRDAYGEFTSWGSFPAIPLNTPAWECTNYESLYDAPPLIGENRAIPGVDGRLPIDRETDQWQVSLRIVVFGNEDLEGDAYDDPRIGVRTNLRYLRTNIFLPSGLRPFQFNDLDGSTEGADVQVVPPFEPVFFSPAAARIVLNMIVPDGVLTAVGS